MKITTEAFGETLAALSGLALDLQRPVITKGLKTAAAPVVFRAKQGARRHDDSGLLADSIGLASVKTDRTGHGIAHIRPSGKAVMVEQTGPDGVKRQKRTRATAYAHIVEFGGRHVSARPYMRPALEQGKEEAVAGFRAEVAAAIDRMNRRTKAKTTRRARAK